VYELKGIGLDGQEKLFQKPWAMTTTMFLGECVIARVCATYGTPPAHRTPNR
jgi:hypothetical protein